MKNIETILLKIELSLAEHMRRTRAAEQRLSVVEDRLLGQAKAIARGQGAVMAIGFLSGAASLAMIALELWPS